MRKKVMSLKEFLHKDEIEYKILQITPEGNTTDYNTESIIKPLSNLYTNFNNRLHINWGEFSYKFPFKISIKPDFYINYRPPFKFTFVINISKKETGFYFIVPSTLLNLVKDKCYNVWKKATIKEVDSIYIPKDSTKFQLTYSNSDALALNCDARSSEPLGSILDILNVMNEKDHISIVYNFMPTDQKEWKNKHKEVLENIKLDKPITKNSLDTGYIVKVALDFIVYKVIAPFFNEVSEFIAGKGDSIMDYGIPGKATEHGLLMASNLKTATTTKGDAPVMNTQILICSKSDDKNRELINGMSVCESYRTLNSDNNLKLSQVNIKPEKLNIYDYRVNKVTTNIMSTKEISNFVQIPGKTILDQHPEIKRKEVLENKIPKELEKGSIWTGKVTVKTETIDSYLTTDKDYKNLAICLVGPTRSGKTTTLANMCKQAIEAGQCIVVPDYIENCGLSADIIKFLPADKVLVIDLSKDENLQGLGFNEVVFDPNKPNEVYRGAKTKASLMIDLMNSVNADDKDLKAKMERYFESACLVVFIQNGSVKDVHEVLDDHEVRAKFISSIPENQKDKMTKYIKTLESLNEKDSKTGEVKGTKYTSITGILDRFNKLERNTAMEQMLDKDCVNNFDLSKLIQQNLAIFIKMPEVMFSSAEERDIFTTYWLLKLWCAFQVRAWEVEDKYKRNTVNIVLDELYQVEHAMDIVKKKISQCAKFGGKFIISCMYLNQIAPLRGELKSANTSYMLISGCDKDNFNELKDELKPFNVDDLLKLPRFHSMNYIKYSGGYAKFISNLTLPNM